MVYVESCLMTSLHSKAYSWKAIHGNNVSSILSINKTRRLRELASDLKPRVELLRGSCAGPTSYLM